MRTLEVMDAAVASIIGVHGHPVLPFGVAVLPLLRPRVLTRRRDRDLCHHASALC